MSSKPKKRQFIGEIEVSNGNASAEELQEAVEALVRQCENKKLRQFWRKYLTPVVNGLDELSGLVGGTGTTSSYHLKDDYLIALVQVVSNIPQAMPLAIVWGGLKFMMGVSYDLECIASIHTKRRSSSGLSVSILSSSKYKMSSRTYRNISSGWLHAKRSTPSRLTVLRAFKGSWPGRTRHYYSFGIG